jgi:hypothetical protein
MLVSLFIAVSASAALIDRENPHATYSFREYADEFGKAYEEAEAKQREATFLANLELIRKQNSAAGETWKVRRMLRTYVRQVWMPPRAHARAPSFATTETRGIC